MNKSANKYQIQEKGRISALQLSLLNITLIISTSDVLLPAFVAQEARQDSWISVIIGTALSFIIINTFLTLGLRYPEKTLVQYLCDILGRPLGKLAGAFFIFFIFIINWPISRQLGEILVISFNPSTPIIVYLIITIFCASYAVISGIEVIARINDIFLPIGLFILLFITLISIPNLNFNNYLPILYNGIYPPVKGGILIQGWMVQSLLLLQLIPFVKDKQNIRKNISFSILILGLSLGLGTLTIGVFGPLTEKLLFPALEYVRYASLGPYIQNFDIGIMLVWVAGIFIKISLHYYVFVVAVSQLFEFKAYKYMTVPIGLIILCFSYVSVRMIPELTYFGHFIFPLYSFTMSFIFPVFLLLISLIRKKDGHTGIQLSKG